MTRHTQVIHEKRGYQRVTVGIIFLMLVFSFGSLRAGFVLLLPIPFAFATGALALYLRDMNMNVAAVIATEPILTVECALQYSCSDKRTVSFYSITSRKQDYSTHLPHRGLAKTSATW